MPFVNYMYEDFVSDIVTGLISNNLRIQGDSIQLMEYLHSLHMFCGPKCMHKSKPFHFLEPLSSSLTLLLLGLLFFLIDAVWCFQKLFSFPIFWSIWQTCTRFFTMVHRGSKSTQVSEIPGPFLSISLCNNCGVWLARVVRAHFQQLSNYFRIITPRSDFKEAQNLGLLFIRLVCPSAKHAQTFSQKIQQNCHNLCKIQKCPKPRIAQSLRPPYAKQASY